MKPLVKDAKLSLWNSANVVDLMGDITEAILLDDTTALLYMG